jgi:addiction module RelB/DinJ family antitoxin
MSNKTVLHTKVDKDIRDEAKKLASELGIPLSTVINAQLREFVRSGRFIVSREPAVSDYVMDELKKASNQAKTKKNISGEFDTVDEMFSFMGI